MSFRRHVFAGLSGIAQIVFFQKPLTSAVFLLAMLVYSPFLALACLTGTIVANTTAWLGGRPRSDIENGLYGYNGALLGLGLATFLSHDLLLWLSIALTAALSVFLYEALRRLGIPPYTMPYVALAWIVLFFASPVSGASAASSGWDWTIPLLGMGQIFFLPSVASSLLIVVGIATACSLRPLLLTLLGALIGCLPFLWLVGGTPSLTAGLMSVNAALSALGMLQGETRHPALRSVCFALGSILLYPLCHAGLAAAGLPALTFPFIATMWTGRVLMLLARRKRPFFFGSST